MLKLRDFKDKGFSVTNTSETSILEKNWAKWLCQKKVYGVYNTKYFINVYISDRRLWDFQVPIGPRTFTIKLYLERKDLTFYIDIVKSGEFQSIIEIEDLCEEVFSTLGCDYYE